MENENSPHLGENSDAGKHISPTGAPSLANIPHARATGKVGSSESPGEKDYSWLYEDYEEYDDDDDDDEDGDDDDEARSDASDTSDFDVVEVTLSKGPRGLGMLLAESAGEYAVVSALMPAGPA